MLGLLGKVFGAGSFKAIENIASEWIETDKEKAEAKTVMIKALDPNGLMRRSISDRVGILYAIYLMSMLLMLAIEFGFKLAGIETGAVDSTTQKLVSLFEPITYLFGVIVCASFGVNATNVMKEK